jgi:hypothetical protein
MCQNKDFVISARCAATEFEYFVTSSRCTATEFGYFQYYFEQSPLLTEQNVSGICRGRTYGEWV